MTAPALPPLSLGTMTFGDTVDEAGSKLIFEAALDAGITWIDTANSYADGRTEQIVGQLVKGREGLVIATKAGQPQSELGTESLLSPAQLRKAVEASLRRLDRDNVDVLYLHVPDRSTPLADTLSTIAELVAEGKISHLGVSNYSAWQVGEIIRIAEQVGAPRPIISQQMYNLVARRLDDEYAEFAQVAGLDTVIYNPLAGGLLTGRYSSAADAQTGRFATFNNAQQYRDRYFNDALFAAVERFSAIADAAGMPLAELALRWTLSRPVVQSVLLGGSKVSHLLANIDAARKGALEGAVLEALDEVGAELRGPMPAYNR